MSLQREVLFPHDPDRIVELADMFRLMADATRLRIILLCLEKAQSVGAIAQVLEVSPSLVSHHLRLLRASRLIQATRQGQHVFYLVSDEHVRRMLGDMSDHLTEDFCDIDPDSTSVSPPDPKS